MPVYKFRVVAPLHDTPFEVVAEGVRPFTHLFVDLLDHALLRFLRTVTFSMYLLEELADAGLAGVVDIIIPLIIFYLSAAACRSDFGLGSVRCLRLPRPRCGFCGWVLGYRRGVPHVAAMRASTAYASSRRRLARVLHAASCALVPGGDIPPQRSLSVHVSTVGYSRKRCAALGSLSCSHDELRGRAAMLILLLLALRATSADENDVYASDDNFVSPTQTADAAEEALAFAARPREPPPAVAAAAAAGVRGVGGSATGAGARDPGGRAPRRRLAGDAQPDVSGRRRPASGRSTATLGRRDRCARRAGRCRGGRRGLRQTVRGGRARRGQRDLRRLRCRAAPGRGRRGVSGRLRGSPRPRARVPLRRRGRADAPASQGARGGPRCALPAAAGRRVSWLAQRSPPPAVAMSRIDGTTVRLGLATLRLARGARFDDRGRFKETVPSSSRPAGLASRSPGPADDGSAAENGWSDPETQPSGRGRPQSVCGVVRFAMRMQEASATRTSM